MDNCVEIFMQLYVVRTSIRGTTPLPQHTIYLWPLCTYGRYKNYFPLRWRKKTNSARSHKAFLEKVFGLEHGEWEMGNVYIPICFFSAHFFNLKWGWKAQSYSPDVCEYASPFECAPSAVYSVHLLNFRGHLITASSAAGSINSLCISATINTHKHP